MFILSTPCNLIEISPRRCGRGAQVDEGGAQGVGKVIEARQADVRLACFELDDRSPADTGLCREGSGGEVYW